MYVNDNLEKLNDEQINSLVREFIIMSADPNKYFSESKKNNSNLEFVNNASEVFTAISKGVDTWISLHPFYTIKNNDGRVVNLSSYLSKNNNYYDKDERVIKYIDKLGYLTSIIPKVDEDFKGLIHYFIRDEFKNKKSNLCINENLDDVNLDNRENYYKLYPQYDFSFEGLKNTYDNYYLRKEEDGFNVYTMDGVRCLDPLIVDRVKFASTWMVCAGVKTSGGYRYSKGSTEYNYAFNDGARDLYYDIMEVSQRKILNGERVDMLDIKNNISRRYKYNDDIINNIFNSDRYIESLEKWIIHSIDKSFDFSSYKNKNKNNYRSI